jgi:hypothetical protein
MVLKPHVLAIFRRVMCETKLFDMASLPVEEEVDITELFHLE